MTVQCCRYGNAPDTRLQRHTESLALCRDSSPRKGTSPVPWGIPSRGQCPPEALPPAGVGVTALQGYFDPRSNGPQSPR